MFIRPKIKGYGVPMMAPLGAAGYTVSEDEGGASILFAMMRADETGLDTLLRVRKAEPNMTWKAVAARPAQQLNSGSGEGDFVVFDMDIASDGTFTGRTEPLRAYLDSILKAGALPKAPPSKFYTSLEIWRSKLKTVNEGLRKASTPQATAAT